MNAKGITGSQKKLVMWYKCNELFKNGLTKSQIARELCLSRKTVRKYLGMSYDEFVSSGAYQREYVYKLKRYEGVVVEWLKVHPDLSSSQVHDWLRERYGESLPSVSPKTVYNFVTHIRSIHSIDKPSQSGQRQYCRVEETEYGEYAQADFGEMWMSRDDGRRLKVYFFVMVLSRSRKKYVWFNLAPFTSELAVYAHEKAFEYYGGKPHKIIYDQDAVLIHDENLGDYVLTRTFRAFVDREHIECVFCRKADPESKGKVENAVKYIKYNFLRGRTFNGISQLNDDALLWLSRTANGLRHGGTGRIPDDVFSEERSYLIPYTGRPVLPERTSAEYKVQKNNTIHYHGCEYSLPSGTYDRKGTLVWVNIVGSTLEIYSKETGKLLARHVLSDERGRYVVDPSHRKRTLVHNRDKAAAVLKYCGGDKLATEWLDNLRSLKPRYYSSNLRLLNKEMVHFSPETLHAAFERGLDSGMYNAKDLIALCDRLGGRIPVLGDHGILSGRLPMALSESPEKTELSTYKKYFS